MVRIKGATFKMGTDAARIPQLAAVFKIERHPDMIAGEAPQHTVTLSAFYIDKYEVSNAQFAEFLRTHPEWTAARMPAVFNNGNYLKDWTTDQYPPDKANHPVVDVSWYAAVAYCQSLGKRLPSEAEWEYAARGGLRNKAFPWGDQPVDKTRANFGGSELNTTTPVGKYRPNGYGLFDLAGNVWEFTADDWGAYSADIHINPVAGRNFFVDGSFMLISSRRVIRGGSYGGAPLNLRVTYRDSHPANGAQPFVGFRCAKW
jgi:formylglycine-generating enzyme required for sulfatase activity